MTTTNLQKMLEEKLFFNRRVSGKFSGKANGAEIIVSAFFIKNKPNFVLVYKDIRYPIPRDERAEMFIREIIGEEADRRYVDYREAAELRKKHKFKLYKSVNKHLEKNNFKKPHRKP